MESHVHSCLPPRLAAITCDHLGSAVTQEKFSPIHQDSSTTVCQTYQGTKVFLYPLYGADS